ncbi:SDR family NAD(P)-dependent oxidoreductase [Marivita hallyeonensis]|uniref:3-oxoacyl-[acyl-carrier protein] reductase n=1 Tax=Marivita hallyeonensis TaxID=996342 RepID=A0A1M5LS75_9RHOB|nr:SDR family oxidoreductase [Marivita hallyeonensis]SHG67947.1 3-oxoacyl-[acyl-carrier protein] reductase [Marivita hallyeonensis]
MSGALAILGGCGGIGRVLVAEATRAGYDVHVIDLPKSIEAHPPGVPAHPADATSVADLERAAEKLPSGLVGLVNLSGFMAESRPVTETEPDLWDEVLTGNLTASYNAARAFHSKLGKTASLVMTGSGLGHFARPGYGPYAVAKAGIAALTRQLALELAPDIRVNAVAPSAVDTAFLRGGTGRSDENAETRLDLDAYARAIPLGRIAEPKDVTGPILFLLSDASRYMTGQVLHVNGGTFMP